MVRKIKLSRDYIKSSLSLSEIYSIELITNLFLLRGWRASGYIQ